MPLRLFMVDIANNVSQDELTKMQKLMFIILYRNSKLYNDLAKDTYVLSFPLLL